MLGDRTDKHVVSQGREGESLLMAHGVVRSLVPSVVRCPVVGAGPVGPTQGRSRRSLEHLATAPQVTGVAENVVMLGTIGERRLCGWCSPSDQAVLVTRDPVDLRRCCAVRCDLPTPTQVAGTVKGCTRRSPNEREGGERGRRL